MDPFSPLDYQLSLLRGGHRTTTSLPIDIRASVLLDNPYFTPGFGYYPPPFGYPYPYPYYPGERFYRRHHHHHHHEHHRHSYC